jgi:hypothetical protein
MQIDHNTSIQLQVYFYNKVPFGSKIEGLENLCCRTPIIFPTPNLCLPAKLGSRILSLSFFATQNSFGHCSHKRYWILLVVYSFFHSSHILFKFFRVLFIIEFSHGIYSIPSERNLRKYNDAEKILSLLNIVFIFGLINVDVST